MALAYSRYLFGTLSWYSSLIVLGILLAYLIGYHEEKRVGLPRDTMTDVTLIAVPCGIIGSRLYYVAMMWPEFAAQPIRILYLWEGGVAIYGAVIGGALGVLLYCYKKKLSFGKVLDIVAPGLLLAQAVGRWGNYFNKEAYGPLLSDPSFQWFPMGVLIPTSGGGYAWHAATFFYECCWNLLGLGALWLLRKKQKQDGNVFLWYLLLYGSGRFIIEQLRMDSLYLLGVRASQWLSLGLCAVAGGMLLWRAAASNKKAFGLAALMMAAALPRWFLTGQVLYGALLAAIAALWIVCLLWQRKQAAFSFDALWFIIPWALDLAFSILSQASAFSLRQAMQLVVTSATLPCYALWLTGWLGRISTQEKGEPHARRSLQK